MPHVPLNTFPSGHSVLQACATPSWFRHRLRQHRTAHSKCTTPQRQNVLLNTGECKCARQWYLAKEATVAPRAACHVPFGSFRASSLQQLPRHTRRQLSTKGTARAQAGRSGDLASRTRVPAFLLRESITAVEPSRTRFARASVLWYRTRHRQSQEQNADRPGTQARRLT